MTDAANPAFAKFWCHKHEVGSAKLFVSIQRERKSAQTKTE